MKEWLYDFWRWNWPLVVISVFIVGLVYGMGSLIIHNKHRLDSTNMLLSCAVSTPSGIVPSVYTELEGYAYLTREGSIITRDGSLSYRLGPHELCHLTEVTTP